MIPRIVRLLMILAGNAIWAIFGAFGLYILLIILFYLAMIAVWIVGGEDVADPVIEFAKGFYHYKWVYLITFLSFIADDLGLLNAKTWMKRKISGQPKADSMAQAGEDQT